MQTLWSRTGLSHRCACRACEQVLGAGRRATTRATKRKATFAEAFTALYSSFLATAAVVDAVRKEDRRTKVDAELEDVRTQLSELRAKRALRELESGVPDERYKGDNIATSDLSDLQNRVLWEQWRQIYDSEGFLDDAFRATGTAEEMLSLNHVRPFGNVRLEGTTIQRAECTRILRHIQAEELDKSVRKRRLFKPVHYDTNVDHLRSYIKGMLVMADKLYAERQMPRESRESRVKRRSQNGSLRAGSPAQDAGSAKGYDSGPGYSRQGRSWDQQRKTSVLPKAWEAFDAPTPEHWYRPHLHWQKLTVMLNDRIRALFRDHDLPLDELIGQISLCLLRSPALPDVHTLNLLMAGFTRRRFFTLASQAYELFFSEDCKHASTPASLALSVTTPAMFWDIPGFKRAAGAIIGRDPLVGAKIGRRPMQMNHGDPWLMSWSSDATRRGMAGRWVYEYAPMNLALREALISSLLHLRQHVDAASFFLACLQTGAGVASAVVFELFNAIAKTPDARSAVRLVRGLSVRSRNFRALLRALPEDIRGCVCRRLDYLLHILSLRTLDEPDADALIQGLGMCRRQLESLLVVLNEHYFSNDKMNQHRSNLVVYEQGSIVVSGEESLFPKSIKEPEAAMYADSAPRTMPQAQKAEDATLGAANLQPLQQSIEQLAPDVDSAQVASLMHGQIHNAVWAKIEKKMMLEARRAVKTQVHAHLERLARDLRKNESGNRPKALPETPSAGDRSDDMFEAGSREVMEQIRMRVQKEVQANIRAQIQLQMKDHFAPSVDSRRESKQTEASQPQHISDRLDSTAQAEKVRGVQADADTTGREASREEAHGEEMQHWGSQAWAAVRRATQ